MYDWDENDWRALYYQGARSAALEARSLSEEALRGLPRAVHSSSAAAKAAEEAVRFYGSQMKKTDDILRNINAHDVTTDVLKSQMDAARQMVREIERFRAGDVLPPPMTSEEAASSDAGKDFMAGYRRGAAAALPEKSSDPLDLVIQELTDEEVEDFKRRQMALVRRSQAPSPARRLVTALPGYPDYLFSLDTRFHEARKELRELRVIRHGSFYRAWVEELDASRPWGLKRYFIAAAAFFLTSPFLDFWSIVPFLAVLYGPSLAGAIVKRRILRQLPSDLFGHAGVWALMCDKFLAFTDGYNDRVMSLRHLGLRVEKLGRLAPPEDVETMAAMTELLDDARPRLADIRRLLLAFQPEKPQHVLEMRPDIDEKLLRLDPVGLQTGGHELDWLIVPDERISPDKLAARLEQDLLIKEGLLDIRGALEGRQQPEPPCGEKTGWEFIERKFNKID